MRTFQARGVISREKPVTDCTYMHSPCKYGLLPYLFDSPLQQASWERENGCIRKANICSRLSMPHQTCIDTLNLLDTIHYVCKPPKIPIRVSCAMIVTPGYLKQMQCSFQQAGTQRRFPPKYLKALFRLSRVHQISRKALISGNYNCSVILGQLQCFRHFKGFCSVLFPENSTCDLKLYESENSSLRHIFESENFRFFVFTKNSLTWVVKYEKLHFRKSQGIYQISFENCTFRNFVYLVRTVIQKFLAVTSNRKFQAIFASSEENSRRLPLFYRRT